MSHNHESRGCPYYCRSREICCAQLDSWGEDEQRELMSFCLSEEYARCPVHAEASGWREGVDAVGRLPNTGIAGGGHAPASRPVIPPCHAG